MTEHQSSEEGAEGLSADRLAAVQAEMEHQAERKETYHEQWMLTEAENARLRARLAEVEALADGWNDVPDYAPSAYDQGRVDQRHDMTMALLEALASPSSLAQREADPEDAPPTPYDPDDAEEAEFLGIAPPLAQRDAEVGARVIEGQAVSARFHDPLAPGTHVLAWPGSRDSAPLVTRTRSEVWTLGSGDRVVMVEGRAGGIALTHIDVLPTRADALAAEAGGES
jgi:hypothetical protein